MRTLLALIAAAMVPAIACHHAAMRTDECPPPPGPPPATSEWTVTTGWTSLAARLVQPESSQAIRGYVKLQPLDGQKLLGAMTDSSGLAKFDSLSPGRYMVTAGAIGFQKRIDTLDVVSGKHWLGLIRLARLPIILTDPCGFPLGTPSL